MNVEVSVALRDPIVKTHNAFVMSEKKGFCQGILTKLKVIN